MTGPERAARAALVDLLVAHQRTDVSGCHCGWGSSPQDLGKSHPAHVADLIVALPDVRGDR